MPTVISSTSSSSHRNRPQSNAGTYTYYNPSPRSSHTSSGRSSGSRDDDRYTTIRDTGDRRFSTYTPTTVSSYQRRTAIDGLPGPQYFSSGQSRTDRRKEYVQRPTPPSTTSLSEGLRAASKELVKYRECEVYDSDDEDSGRERRREEQYKMYDDFDDRQTVKPSDSISQISYPASYAPSSRSSVSGGRRRRQNSGVDVGGVGDIYGGRGAWSGGAGSYGSGSYSSSSGGGGSTFSNISTFQSEKVFDGTRQCWLVERRPRASAMGRLTEVR